VELFQLKEYTYEESSSMMSNSEELDSVDNEMPKNQNKM
jgi:hypothetical protein